MPNLNLAEVYIDDDGEAVPGYRETQNGVSPAAGAAFLRPIDGLGLRRLRSLTATFTTSATVANRFPTLNVLDGDNNLLYQATFLIAVTAGLTVQISAYAGVTPQTNLVNNKVLLATPLFFLAIGEKLQLSADGLQAGDTFTNIHMVWEVVPLGRGGIDQEGT